MDLKFRYRHKGDIKVVYRTAASAPFLPMPEIKGEKDFNPYYIMLQMDREAPLLVINKVLCIVDYQPDGMSAGLFRQYEESPVSFGMLRLQYLKMPRTALVVPVQAVYALCVFLDVCQKTAQTGAQSSCVQHRHDHGASAGNSASFLYFIKKSERQKNKRCVCSVRAA